MKKVFLVVVFLFTLSAFAEVKILSEPFQPPYDDDEQCSLLSYCLIIKNRLVQCWGDYEYDGTFYVEEEREVVLEGKIVEALDNWIYVCGDEYS